MTTQDSSPNLVTKLQQQRSILEQVPDRSKAGFSLVASQMGSFSVGFASGVTQAFALRERLAAGQGDFGIKQLREDYRNINQEINAIFQDILLLISEEATIKEHLHNITDWALELEQEAFLPAIVDQIKSSSGNKLELQTLGSMIDSLMRQVRTLIREIILSTQEATNLLSSLSRRLSADLGTSKHGFSTLKSRSTTLMEQMTETVKIMDLCCESMEHHSTKVNSVVFEMVQAIQYDDISAQRLDHSIKTLEHIEQRLAKTELADEDKRWAAIATSIVTKHLEDISTDLVTAVEALHQHLTQIKTVAIERKNAVISARDSGMTFQQNILDLVYHLSALLRMSIFDNDFSSELLRHFSKTENAVFQTKRSFDTLHLTSQRLEKLLTTLDCKNSHRMETLSKTIGQLTGRIQKEGSDKSQQLLKITNQLQDVSLGYSEKSTPKIMRTTTLLRRVPLLAQQMESDHNDVLRVVNETIGETQSIIIQTKLLTAEMNFHTRIQKGIEHITQHLEELLPEMVDIDVINDLRGNLPNLAEEFTDLSNLYTMASERLTHGAVLGDSSTEEIFGDDDDGCELF